MLDLLRGLPDSIDPVLACPNGPLASAARGLGVPVRTIRGTDSSLRLHPLHTTRGLLDVARAALHVRHLARGLRADVVHANSIRASVVASIARKLGGPPVLAHVRDRLPAGRLTDLSFAVIARGADLVVANSAYTAEPIPRGSGRAPVHVVDNPVDLERFDPDGIDRVRARAHFQLSDDDVVLSVIAQLTPWKAQDDAIRVLAVLRGEGVRARLLVVGDAKFVSRAARYDNAQYRSDLTALCHRLEMDDHVTFTGELESIPQVLRATDVLLVPSWEEPFGRTVIEGMAMGVVVVATSVGGPSEIITDQVDGVLVAPRQPERWSVAVQGLVESPATRERMGSAARRTAVARFSRQHHVDAIVCSYVMLAGST